MDNLNRVFGNLSPLFGLFSLIPCMMSFAEDGAGGGTGDGDGDGGDGGDGNAAGNAGGEGGSAGAGDAGAGAGAGASSFTWKDKVGVDLANSPTLQKFEDTPEGLQEAVKSHLNLEKLLGHEKVPLPKDENDAEGIARFNKALGVPETAEGYNLIDPTLPEEMKGLTFDKTAFANIVHKYNLTPKQAEGVWKEYTDLSGGIYQKHVADFQTKLAASVNALKGEWGDAYESNVAISDMVVNKFSADKEMNDFVTASLTKSPMGLKFLAKIGAQFAENKVGEFKYTKYSMTPEEAGNEVSKIKGDVNHAYNSEKATTAEHEAAIDFVNRLTAISMGKKL